MDQPNKMVGIGSGAEGTQVRDETGKFILGHPPTSPGRPKGKTIKELVREWLEDNPDDKRAFVEHFVRKNKELAWQMLEGRPQQDVTSGGEKLPTPIYGGLSGHNSNQEDIPAQEGN